MMAEEPALLRGIVEFDETFVGGRQRPRNKPAKPAPAPLLGDDDQDPPATAGGKTPRKGRGGGKAMAFTMVERGGRRIARPLASHGTAVFWPPVRDAVARDAIISTDELPAYRAIGAMQAGQLRVNHSAGEYARTDAATGLRAHVNTAESVHACFKRAIIGVWHQISRKHMGLYLRVVEFRWNNHTGHEPRMRIMFSGASAPLPLKALLA